MKDLETMRLDEFLLKYQEKMNTIFTEAIHEIGGYNIAFSVRVSDEQHTQLLKWMAQEGYEKRSEFVRDILFEGLKVK